MIFNKKGEFAISKLVAILLAVAVLFVLIAIFFPMIFDLGGNFEDNSNALSDDTDSDSLKDFQDDCPCTYGSLENDGCPSGFSDEEIKADKQKYNSGECDE